MSKVLLWSAHYSEPSVCCASAFLIHMSIIWIYVMSRLWPASRPDVLHGKNFNSVEHYMQTVQPKFSYLPCI